MSRSNAEPYNVINLFDWTGGLRDKRQNPLVYPVNALMAGENVDLVDGGLKTRRGFSTAFLSPHRVYSAKPFPPTLVDEPIYGHSAVYDPVAHQMVVFGGLVGGDPDNHVRILGISDGIWTARAQPPPHGPAARAFHTAVYDSVNRAMWVFGGANTSGSLDDELWRYDLNSLVWQQVVSHGIVPSARCQHSAIYDPVAGAIFIFGGRTGSVWSSGGAYFNNLYRYDIARNDCIILNPAGGPPSPRYGHAAVYEPAGRSILVFCGYSAPDEQPVADLWKYDIAANTWSQIRSAEGGPTPHLEAALGLTAVCFEPLHAVVLFGGVNPTGPGPQTCRLWTYDVAANRYTDTDQDLFRDGLWFHSAVYDQHCQGIIVTGGQTGGGPVNDCWGFGFSGLCAYTAGSSAVGEFRSLDQVRFPTNETSYLVTQVEVSGVSTLYASDQTLPVASGSGSFFHLYDLGTAAGTCSVAVLNDRAVITEGVRNPPLVFAGCMDPSGADWAVPKAVLVTSDDGGSWHDITPEVCDRDPDTYGDLGNLPANSGWLAICVDMSGVTRFSFDMDEGNTQPGSLIVEGHSGSWSSGAGWIDHTSGLGRNGTVVHPGEVFAADYHVENGVPGYWFRLRWASGTSQATRVRRILFRAPCQHLQVIGEGQPDSALGFLYWDESEKSAKDYTVEVSDSTYPSFARLNDGGLENPSGMGSSDAIYIGYLTRFNAVELTPHNDYHNESGAVLSGYYWTGTSWAGLSGLTDGTQEPSGTLLGKKGKIVWPTPANWRQNRPISPQYPHGYWVKLQVSTKISPKTYISEAAVWPVLNPLKKHRFALTVRDRMVLCNRTDAPDQIDISRALEEYGFAGTDSYSLRIGGQGETVAAIEAFNQGFIAKTDDWYLLNGYNPQTFSVERAEAAGQAPINNRVVVRAPHTEADLKNLMGLYYINQAGAWYFAGLKVYQISQDVSWWDASTGAPRLDLNNLYKACGVYWPERNWVIWSVPMIVEGTEQETNNRLIVCDLTLKTWLPPFTISVASLATAYHHNSNAPGKLGPMGLYGGTYNGEVIRLFGPQDTRDRGQPIQAWAETGWLHFGSPEYVKLLRMLTMYGKTLGNRIILEVFSDGDESSPAVVEYRDLSGLGTRLFGQEQEAHNIRGRFFKFRISFIDVTDVYGFQIGASAIREWGNLS